MSILTYLDLVELVNAGHIEGVELDSINGASIDLTLGDTLLIEKNDWGYPHGAPKPVKLWNKEGPVMVEAPLVNGVWTLLAGQFALAETREVFHLPDDIAGHYMLKSSLARGGMQHLFAGWCDPTWHSSVLTLELVNQLMWQPLELKPGMKIGQMVFWRGKSVPHDKSYAVRGRYNRSASVTETKGV